MANNYDPIIDALYSSYIDGAFDDCKPLMGEDIEEQDTALMRIIDATDIGESLNAEIFERINEETSLAERKGFAAGLKIGARLILNLINGER